MRVYIDLGACIGDTMEKAMEKWPDCDRYIGFEPHPDNFKKLKERFEGKDNVYLHQVAASDSNGTFDLYLSSDTIEGHSFYKKKWNVKDETIKVKAINFAKWLNDSFEVDDYIILKMNVEGEEYAILRKMFNNGAIDKIRVLFVSWHNKKIGDFDQMEHNFVQFQLHKRDIQHSPFPR